MSPSLFGTVSGVWRNALAAISYHNNRKEQLKGSACRNAWLQPSASLVRSLVNGELEQIVPWWLSQLAELLPGGVDDAGQYRLMDWFGIRKFAQGGHKVLGLREATTFVVKQTTEIYNLWAVAEEILNGCPSFKLTGNLTKWAWIRTGQTPKCWS